MVSQQLADLKITERKPIVQFYIQAKLYLNVAS